jgi:carnitine-CoA ligase
VGSVRWPRQTSHSLPREAGSGILRLFPAYWNHPRLAPFRWHGTGDLGRLDEDGILTFAGRISDSIRRCGEMVSALELEQAVSRHPRIAEVAAVGVEVLESVDQAIEICGGVTPEAIPTVEELSDFCRTVLPYFAVPPFVEFVANLPPNASHKVAKAGLEDPQPGSELTDLAMLVVVAAQDRGNAAWPMSNG